MNIQTSRYRIGVDIGGTFTDVVMVDEITGAIEVTKVSTVPADPSRGFLDGLDAAFAKTGVAPGAVAFIVHGTTIATNTIIQGKGARAGLITSEGFSDVLEIAYQVRPSLYDLFYEKPKALVPRSMCIGVPERQGPDGEVLTALDEAAVAAAADRLVAAGAEAIAIAFLHAYRNPEHERRAAAVVSARHPDVPVILSSDVCPEYREYPRTSTTVVNAVLIPKVAPYLQRLDGRLEERGVEPSLHLMTSSGGIVTSGMAKRLPVTLVESGPAAGVIGAAFVAGALSDPSLGERIIALDIGGTTAKVSLVDGGQPALADEFEVGSSAVPTSTAGRGAGYPVKMPVINLVEIGAGGGSIAGIDPGGALAVGPESAGAVPGPACYGLGGDRPTITDANVVLGRLNPDYFLGGALTIYPELSRNAIETHVAGPLGIGLETAARAIIDIANAKMISAMQLVSIRRGIDPRDYTLVPSGGSGPVHALAIARSLGMPSVIIPPTPGLNSALGLLATDVKHEIVRTIFRPLAQISVAELGTTLDEMAAQGRKLLEDEDVPSERIAIIREADICYIGQNYPLRVAVPVEGDLIAAADAAFRVEHRRRYGFASDTEPTNLLNLRLTAVGPVERPILKPLPAGNGDPSAALKGRRRVVFDEAIECPIYDRTQLLAGDIIVGPAIVEQMDTTVVIPDGARVTVDRSASLVAELNSRT